MLTPKKTKYRKQFRGKMRGKSLRGSNVNFGEYGLKAVSAGWVSSRQIEAGRKSITHHTKRGGRIFIRIFPHKPITKKPPEARMGTGKGDVSEYVAVVKPGRIIYEIAGVSESLAKEAFRRAGAKLPVKTKFVSKEII